MRETRRVCKNKMQEEQNLYEVGKAGGGEGAWESAAAAGGVGGVPSVEVR